MFVNYSITVTRAQHSFYLDDPDKWWRDALGYACLWPAFTTRMEILRDWRKGL
jgi:hypothetical protein